MAHGAMAAPSPSPSHLRRDDGRAEGAPQRQNLHPQAQRFRRGGGRAAGAATLKIQHMECGRARPFFCITPDGPAMPCVSLGSGAKAGVQFPDKVTGNKLAAE